MRRPRRRATREHRVFSRAFARALREHDDTRALGLVQRHAMKVGGCWIWPGAIGKTGYGVLNTAWGTLRAHRLVYRIAYGGDLPAASVIHHRCAVRACVNPAHLQHVRHVDNVAEMRARNAYLAELSIARDLLARLRARYRPDEPDAVIWAEVDHVLAVSLDLTDEDDPLLAVE